MKPAVREPTADQSPIATYPTWPGLARSYVGWSQLRNRLGPLRLRRFCCRHVLVRHGKGLQMSLRLTLRGIVCRLILSYRVVIGLGLSTLGLMLLAALVRPTSAQPAPISAIGPARLAAQALPLPSPAARAGLAIPLGVAADPAGGLYVSGQSHVLHFSGTSITADRVYGTGDGRVGSIGGQAGPTTLGLDDYASRVAADPAGGLYVADTSANRVLHFSGSSTIADRVYGQNDNFAGFSPNMATGRASPVGPVTAKGLFSPQGVATDSGGVYIADTNNNRVLHFSGDSTAADRVYGPNGSFTTATFAFGDT